MKKTLIIIAIVLAGSYSTSAQQTPLNSQFMYNKLAYNPAFAGYYSKSCFQLSSRNQWLGFEGAPNQQAIALHLPFFQRKIGLGFELQHSGLAVENNYSFKGSYAYRFPISGAEISIGVNAGLKYYQLDYSGNDIYTIQSIQDDPNLAGKKLDQINFDAGLGLYLESRGFLIGVSLPDILTNQLKFSLDDIRIGEEVLHGYGIIGYHFPVNYKWHMMPQLLIRYAENTPIDFDVNISARWDRLLDLGLSYRFSPSQPEIYNSLDMIAAVHMDDRWMLGASYGFNLSELSDHQSGSVEFFLRILFGEKQGTQMANPRYF